MRGLGPIPCPAASLNAIYQTIPGWDSITNPSDGVIGENVESRADFEFRRQQSVAINADGVLPAIRAAVFAVPGVTDVYTTENDTGSPVTIGGVSIGANSLYVAVSGGAAQAVAQAIWSRKNPGCAYTGNTTETVQDTSYPYVAPYPSYSVTFETPTAETVVFLVTLSNNVNVPSNALTLIQGAILAAFLGADGGSRARILIDPLREPLLRRDRGARDLGQHHRNPDRHPGRANCRVNGLDLDHHDDRDRGRIRRACGRSISLRGQCRRGNADRRAAHGFAGVDRHLFGHDLANGGKRHG